MENRGVRYAIAWDREGKQATCLYVSFEDEPGRHSAAKLLSCEVSFGATSPLMRGSKRRAQRDHESVASLWVRSTVRASGVLFGQRLRTFRGLNAATPLTNPNSEVEHDRALAGRVSDGRS
jgi:hypothetical protein